MIVPQIVVVHLVSRSLPVFGVVSRFLFFTLHQMWLPFLVVLPQYLGDMGEDIRSNKEDKQQRIKNNVELVR